MRVFSPPDSPLSDATNNHNIKSQHTFFELERENTNSFRLKGSQVTHEIRISLHTLRVLMKSFISEPSIRHVVFS